MKKPELVEILKDMGIDQEIEVKEILKEVNPEIDSEDRREIFELISESLINRKRT